MVSRGNMRKKATAADARPVTFYTLAVENGSNTPTERRCGCYGIAGELDDDDDDDDDDMMQLFVTRDPGQLWTTTRRLQDRGFTDLPRDVVACDVFRYAFMAPWWIGGTGVVRRSSTDNTIVKLPCWITGKVTEPEANGGRPVAIMPSSEAAEFTLVE
ncbi:hypothetical protein F5Y09DRAFT_346951 [Xylaria sp. FL1042]|nr:hypothetical protein F5Y09DRAFT_346951 [Xylaria sp. FL1042]